MKRDIGSELICAFDQYIDAYFHERDPDKTFSMLSSSLTGFGTGLDETARDFGRLKELYLRDFEQAPSKIDTEFMYKDVTVLSDAAGYVSALFSLKTVISGQPVTIEGLRLSVIFLKEPGSWKICHMHISLPTAVHEEGESYPLKELQERNLILEQMVAEKTSELEERNRKLEDALANVRQLSGLLPICASCKKIRDDAGYWHQIENYIRIHSEAEFSHGLCPDCSSRMMDELSLLRKSKDKRDV